jgi:hypothetical protein
MHAVLSCGRFQLSHGPWQCFAKEFCLFGHESFFQPLDFHNAIFNINMKIMLKKVNNDIVLMNWSDFFEAIPSLRRLHLWKNLNVETPKFKSFHQMSKTLNKTHKDARFLTMNVTSVSD